MELACLSTHFLNGGMTFAELLRECRQSDVHVLELGVANMTATPGINAHSLLESPRSLEALRTSIDEQGLRIGALNCFGNPLHPIAEKAEDNQRGIEDAIHLAAKLGVRTVVTASGCPGDTAWPVWISWPLYWQDLEQGQWDLAGAVWSRLASIASDADVDLCLKLHPGQVVYNPSSFDRLSDACGPSIKAALDPAHLFYQGMDPIRVATHLGSRLGHVHAKDAILDPDRIALDGVIDPSPLDRLDRAWRCAAVGEGHGVDWWRGFLSELEALGYQGLVSIEHEDARLGPTEALRLNAERLASAGLRS